MMGLDIRMVASWMAMMGTMITGEREGDTGVITSTSTQTSRRPTVLLCDLMEGWRGSKDRDVEALCVAQLRGMLG
jgi:hypothetical protein